MKKTVRVDHDKLWAVLATAQEVLDYDGLRWPELGKAVSELVLDLVQQQRLQKLGKAALREKKR